MYCYGVKSLVLITLMVVGMSAAANEDVLLEVGGERLNGTWFEPSGDALGMVHLQHGFSRTRKNVNHLAETFRDEGFLVLTTDLTVRLATNKVFAAAFADYLLDLNLPQKKIMVGHSVGAEFSVLTSEALMRKGRSPVGVLILDMVPHKWIVRPALEAIDGQMPILSILTKRSSCNALNAALPLIQDLSPSFKGFRLPTGTHCDPEGDSSNSMCNLVCGLSDTKNVAVVFDFSTNWMLGWVLGNKNSEYYPGGAVYEGQLSTGRIRSL